jgi:phage tail-like protein
MPMKHPTPKTNFRLTLGGMEAASMFREFSGFSSSFSPVTDTWENDAAKPEHAKFPQGAPDWDPISVERSLDKNMDLWKWFEACHIKGEWFDQLKEGQLELLNYKGDVVMTFKIKDAWPSEYSISEFDYSQPTTPATERIEIIHGGIERIK